MVLRPLKDAHERQKTFDRYREELIGQAGIAVFVMGNKDVGGKPVNADGVRAEFYLAKERGLYLLLIGASPANRPQDDLTGEVPPPEHSHQPPPLPTRCSLPGSGGFCNMG